MNVSIDDGKYEYRCYPNGESEVLRYGESWRDTVGDKFIYCMAAEIETLRKQRDELLAALEKFNDAHEECTDFDGFTAQIVSMDDYHEAQEAIAGVKGGA